MPENDQQRGRTSRDLADDVEPFLFWGLFFAIFFAGVVVAIHFYFTGQDEALLGTLIGVPLALTYYAKTTVRDSND